MAESGRRLLLRRLLEVLGGSLSRLGVDKPGGAGSSSISATSNWFSAVLVPLLASSMPRLDFLLPPSPALLSGDFDFDRISSADLLLDRLDRRVGEGERFRRPPSGETDRLCPRLRRWLRCESRSDCRRSVFLEAGDRERDLERRLRPRIGEMLDELNFKKINKKIISKKPHYAYLDFLLLCP